MLFSEYASRAAITESIDTALVRTESVDVDAT